MLWRHTLIVMAALAAWTTTHASTFLFNGNPVDVEYWAGAGSQADNTALLVVDFGTGNPSYAFGFGWDGGQAHTGWDMINSVATGAPDALAFTHHEVTGLGEQIDTFQYDGNTMGTGGYPVDYVYSFLSQDGTTWTTPASGAEGVFLASGDYYGWTHQNEGWYEDPQNPGSWLPPVYGEPNVPVPEPATISLFLLGLGVVARRHLRRKRA